MSFRTFHMSLIPCGVSSVRVQSSILFRSRWAFSWVGPTAISTITDKNHTSLPNAKKRKLTGNLFVLCSLNLDVRLKAPCITECQFNIQCLGV